MKVVNYLLAKLDYLDHKATLHSVNTDTSSDKVCIGLCNELITLNHFTPTSKKYSYELHIHT